MTPPASIAFLVALLPLAVNSLGTNKPIEKLTLQIDPEYTMEVLKEIMVPRVAGTIGNTRVRDYIINELQTNGFNVELDQFTDWAPEFGNVNFTNIVAMLNPYASKFLVLSCHYDTKYYEQFEFLGATDSAVPCAMLLNLIHTMRDDLERIKYKPDVSLMLVFFDGEEATQKWTDLNSLFGARHLAKAWESDYRTTAAGTSASMLERVEVLVLLDLIGHRDVVFNNYFEDTSALYKKLSAIEHLLQGSKALLGDRAAKYFPDIHKKNDVQDDHLPFKALGVPILYLIPQDFPKVWHTKFDNWRALDFKTIENLNMILRVFVADYFHLIPSVQ